MSGFKLLLSYTGAVTLSNNLYVTSVFYENTGTVQGSGNLVLETGSGSTSAWEGGKISGSSGAELIIGNGAGSSGNLQVDASVSVPQLSTRYVYIGGPIVPYDPASTLTWLSGNWSLTTIVIYINQGTLDIRSNGTLSHDSACSVQNNGGKITHTHGGTSTLGIPVHLFNGGTMTLDDGGATGGLVFAAYQQDDTSSSGIGTNDTLTIDGDFTQNNGTTTVSQSGTISVTGNYTQNAGTLSLDLQGVLTVGNQLSEAGGTIQGYEATVNATTAGVSIASGATFTWLGTVNGNLTNNGTLATDAVFSSLAINGSFTQGSGGTLNLRIGQSGAHDSLAVGVASFGGTLNVTSINYTPVVGDSYELITYTTRNGTAFATVNLPPTGGYPPGQWLVSYNDSPPPPQVPNLTISVVRAGVPALAALSNPAPTTTSMSPAPGAGAGGTGPLAGDAVAIVFEAPYVARGPALSAGALGPDRTDPGEEAVVATLDDVSREKLGAGWAVPTPWQAAPL